MKWIRREASSGLLDFSELEGWKDESPPYTALAACWIECREELSVEIRFTSSGDYELQLDRRVLSDARARPGTPPDPLRQRITLGKGWHSLLVKASRADGKLALQLRILTPAGEKAPGLKVWQ